MARVLGVTSFAAVGGVLFGLDQGNWGGAIVKEGFVQSFCKGPFERCHNAALLPEEYARFLSLGSSLLQFGAAFGAMLAAPGCAQRFGRQEAMFLGSLITIVGCLLQAAVVYPPYFLVARMFAGAGVGIVTYALPMFVSEIAPAEMRGILGCFMQLTMVCGTLVASLLNCQPWFGYELSFALPALPAMIVVGGIFFFPTSPRFALVQGQRLGLVDGGEEKAWKALLALRGSEEAANEELAIIKESLVDESQVMPWSHLWREPSIRRRLFVANLLQWMQQLSGVNAILSYGPAIFQSADVPFSALHCAVVTNMFNLIGTLVMMAVIDRLGRRFLLLAGAAAMFVFMSASAYLASVLMTLDPDVASRQVYGWSLLFCVCFYMSSFAVAWGGVPWVYPSEIFPMSAKEKAMSTSVCSQWTANFLIAYIVPQQVQQLSVSGTFAFYSVCILVNFAIVFCCVPETKGVELEHMDALFGAEQKDIAALLVPSPGIPHVDSHACSLSGLVSKSAPSLTAKTDGGSVPHDMKNVPQADKHKFRRWSSEGDLDKAQRWRASARVFMAPSGSVALY